MTKKHFEAIAHTLNANRADVDLVRDLMDDFEETNPRFDRKAFFLAATANIRGDAQRLVSAVF